MILEAKKTEKMKNIFRFHPVGQGLFYTGNLLNNEYNFIYDCGTDNKQRIVHSCIDKYVSYLNNKTWDQKPIIDFAVISHLHHDHFSGIHYLSQKCRIKKYYLPYIGGDQNLISLILANAFSVGSDELGENQIGFESFLFLRNLYLETTEYEIVFIGNQLDDNLTETQITQVTEVINDENGKEYWKFLLFCKPFSRVELKQYALKLAKYIKQMGIINFDNFIKNNIQKCNFKEIKKVYQYVFGEMNINSTSISLLHYPVKEGAYKAIRIKDCCCRNCYCIPQYYLKEFFNKENASLLTGDAEFDMDMGNIVNSDLEKMGNSLFITQIPHHGAYENWFALEVSKINCNHYVIPFGLGNKYCHPNTETINELLCKNVNIYNVTQIDSFNYILTV